MVMPRSRSNSLESITLSACASLARQVPLWFSMASTSVVLPWSTCAMMAILRMLVLKRSFHDCRIEGACAYISLQCARRHLAAIIEVHAEQISPAKPQPKTEEAVDPGAPLRVRVGIT